MYYSIFVSKFHGVRNFTIRGTVNTIQLAELYLTSIGWSLENVCLLNITILDLSLFSIYLVCHNKSESITL